MPMDFGVTFRALVIAKMQAEVREVNEANGWFESDRSVGDDVALLHSEVSEAFEAYREQGFADATQMAACAVCGSVQAAGIMHVGAGTHSFSPKLPKPEGWGSELADVLVRLLDTCERTGVDLVAEFNRKLDYNCTRGYRHGGKVV